jgi:long-chain acyl-CoA synthetase
MIKKLDTITPEQAQTLYGLFLERFRKSASEPAYRSFNAELDDWEEINWQQVADNVSCWQKALAQENLQAGDRVALNLRNCTDWVFFDLAAMGLELIVVPLYPDDRPENVAYILQDADVKVLFLQHIGQWKKLQPSLSDKHNLERVIINTSDDETLSTLAKYKQDWLPEQGDELRALAGNVDPHKLASIIYTSGTTGKPKGVMLSHHNMLSVAYGGLQYFDIYTNDVFLSFLPLSHTFERTVGYYLPIMSGAVVTYSRGIPQLAQDLELVKPDVLIAVPRVLERIHSRLQSQLEKKPFIAKLLFKMAAAVGWARFQYQQKRASWHPAFLLWPLLNKAVASKLQQRLGGNLRILITGGAALPQQVSKLFIGLGVNVLQGYGLTETSPVISVNEPNNNFPSSVGRPIPGIDVMIGDNQELLAKGPGIMLGYWNNHKATAQTINPEGWLHTGDQARIGKSGHIYITGRIKDILVMSNGEKVPPADIEAAILNDELFDQATVIGEGESFLSAVLVLNSELWSSFAKAQQLDPFDNESLLNKKLNTAIIHRLREHMTAFPAYAKIRRVILSLEPWTIDNGLLTATMKVKRREVIQAFQTAIDAIYK